MVEFSKTHQAWQVVFEVFHSAAQLSDTELFQAAIILKSKMMFDFVALRFHCNEDISVQMQMRDRVLTVMQTLSDPHFRSNGPAPRFILNVLATAFAYFSIHIHAKWPSLISDVSGMFQTDIDRAFVLLSILKYMADDCDHESIVVEDSVRTSFFNYLDSQAGETVFSRIFEPWAKNMSMVQDQKKAG